MREAAKIARFTIPGEPCGKGRPRAAMVGGHAVMYTPQKTQTYESVVRTEYARQCLGIFFEKEEALRVEIRAYKTMPKSASRKKVDGMLAGIIRPGKKPDWDNVGKIVCDALNGVAYHDDSQVVEAVVRKLYSEKPFVVVEISPCGING